MSITSETGSMFELDMWYGMVRKHVEQGLLDPKEAVQAIRDASNGRFRAMRSWCMPDWWRTYKLQIQRASLVWPNRNIPDPPELFVGRTSTEVPVLHVPDDPSFIWSQIETRGFDKRCGIDFGKLIINPYKQVFDKPVWLAIDVEHGRGKSVGKYRGRSDLAGIEVLSAMLQFPGWFEHWFVKGAAAPILGGYRLPDGRGELTETLILSQWHGADKNVNLSQVSTAFYNAGWVVPTVRLLEY